MKVRNLADFLPFCEIKDGCVLSKRGDATFGWRVELPTAFTVNENGYDSIINSFRQAYKLLPPWCIIHKQDIFAFERYHTSPNGFFLADAYSKHFDGRRYLNGQTYLYLTFSSKANIERKNSSSGFFGFLDSKVPKQESLEHYADIASQFESVLGANPLLTLTALSSEDFLRRGEHGRDEGVIPDYLRMYDPEGPDYNFVTEKDHVRYGEKELRIWYVEDSDAYPGSVSSTKNIAEMSSGTSQVFLSGGSPIGYLLRIPHIVNRYVVTIPKGVIEKELDTKKRVNTSFSNYSGECAVNAAELEDYLHESAGNNSITVKCFMNLMAWGTREDFAAIRNAVVTAFRSDLDVSVVEEDMIAPLHFYAAIPGAEAENGYDNYLNSELLAFLCHGLWDGYDFGMKDGVVHVCDRRTMTPVTLDIQSVARSKGLINNMNAIVIGPSGSGKSFTMNSLVQDFYVSGQHTVVIDIGDSYQGICSVINEYSGGKDGVYNTYDPEHPFAFNPFKGRSRWNETDEEGERTSSGMEFLLSLVKTIYKPEGGWNSESSSALKFLIMQFLDWWDNGVPPEIVENLQESHVNDLHRRAVKNGRKFSEAEAKKKWQDPVAQIFGESRAADPVFDDFYKYVTTIVAPLMRDENFKMGDIYLTEKIIDTERFGAAMDMYKRDGVYGFLLNAELEADLFESRFTVFEVDRIKDNSDLFPLWVLCIMHSFEEKMRSLPCQKVLIIEEAWKAIATETMANFIVWMWRTARKFRTSAVVVTQDVNDLTGSDIVRDAIILNSDVRILLDQRKNANNFQRAATVLGLSPMATNLVLSVNTNLNPEYRYKEAFFQIGENYSNVFAVEVSKEQALCFETDKTLKAPLLAKARATGSFIKAIEFFSKQK